MSETSENYVGLLGDVIAGNAHLANDDDKRGCIESTLDCSLFKAVGTAIQDVITAHEVYQEAIAKGVGTEVKM